MTFVLIIESKQDYGSVPEVHGPFSNASEGETYAREYRKLHDIPGQDSDLPTEEEIAQWEDAGWRFHLVAPTWEVASQEPL